MKDLDQRLAALSPEKRALLLQQLAKQQSAAKSAAPAAEAQSGARPAILPLSPNQQGLWLLSQMSAASSAYHMPLAFTIQGELKIDALQSALDQLLQRHEALRTVLLQEGEQIQQKVLPACTCPLRQMDARTWSPTQLQAMLEQEIWREFDFTQAPLLRALLLHTANDEALLLLNLHHIAADGWSLGVLKRDLSALYAARTLPALSLQYADYALQQQTWLGSAARNRQQEFWQQSLRAAPALLELASDFPRPPQQSYAGGKLAFSLDQAQTRALRQLAQKHNVSLYMVVLAAWGLLLSRLAGQEEVVIGSPVANRGRAEWENVVGFFVNTLALRISPAGSVADLLNQVKNRLLDAQEYQQLPFEQVVQALQVERSSAYTPVFQAMLAWQNTEDVALDLAGCQVTELEVGSAKEGLQLPYQIAKYDLEMHVHEGTDGLHGYLAYASALFKEENIATQVQYLQQILHSMALDDQQPVAQIGLMNAVQQARLAHFSNPTPQDFPQNQLLADMIEAQVAATPQQTALIWQQEKISYAELNQRANRLAHYLRQLGAGPEKLVAICSERNTTLVVAMLAVLKTGAGYVPLDPSHPLDRLGYMLQDSAACILLTHSQVDADLRASLQACGAGQKLQVLDLEQDQAQWAALSADNPPRPQLQPSHLAYVLYTSGSTGMPKGVMVEQGNVANFIQAMTQEPGLQAGDALLAVTTIGFDISVLEIFLPLCRGAHLILASREDAADAQALQRLLQEHKVSHFQATPATWKMLDQAGWEGDPQLVVMAGGEAFPTDLAQRLAPRVRELWNLYGPTEATVYATGYRFEARRPWYAASLPIGKPCVNTRIYILNAHLQPVAPGESGEMYIGGPGVARGYMNRPDLSQERFLPDPFLGGTARMYRTGDLGRWLADGNIDYLGRNDFQVKIRGFRIELGEIEARLAQYPGVAQAVVLAREDVPGEKRLVAYLRCAQMPEIGALRQHLAHSLPDYMVPAAYVQVADFALTPSGKLDRKALPAPDASAYQSAAYQAPQGELEQQVAELWTQLLKLEQVGRFDHFFALGGHSLLAVSFIARLQKQVQVQASLRDLFAQPVLADFARLLADRGNTAQQSRIPRLEADHPAVQNNRYPLSFAQQRLWFLAQMEGISEAYHIPLAFSLRGDLHRAALHHALDQLLHKHSALRTVFGGVGEDSWQSMLPPSPFALQVQDLRDLLGTLPQAERAAHIEEICRQEGARSFDLRHGPLIRGQLLHVADAEHLLLITMHHIVSDGWSLPLLLRALEEGYRAALQEPGQTAKPGQALNYVDYCVWQRQHLQGEHLQNLSAYWRQALQGAPALLELPLDYPRPPLQTYAGALLPLRLDAGLTQSLKQLAQQEGMTLFMLVLAAWGLVLSRLSGQDEIVIGSPVANRTRSECDDVIGLFVNTLALKVALNPQMSVRSLLKQVQQTTLDAQQHQELPFEQVVDILQPPRSLAHTPLFQVMLAWQNLEQADLHLPGLQVQDANLPYDIAKVDLELSLGEQNGALVGSLGYATALFKAETVARQAGYLQRILQGFVRHGLQAPLQSLEMLGVEEKQTLLHQFNASRQPYAQDVLLHEMVEQQVEQQVARQSNATALLFDGTELSYQELNARANRLARHLRSLGAGPEQRIAICVERSLEMVIGLLAILKAGAAYVPLDPSYPLERLAHMLEDSAPLAVLSHSVVTEQHAQLRATLAAGSAHLLLLDQPQAWAQQDGGNLQRDGLQAHNLAYVIYTSGSTGKPKGAMNEHRGIVNRLQWMQRAYQLDASDVVLQKTSFSFDVSVWEFFWPLLSGAKLVLARPEGQKDPVYLAQLIQTQGVTTLHFVPSMLQVFLETPYAADCHSLKRVVTSGEALAASLARRLRERLPQAGLHNLYGPTEAAVDVTYWDNHDTQIPAQIPIGKPVANTQIYLLDSQLQPVPLGAAGEIHIGGVQVGRGYLNRPELTQERFIPDPFQGGAARLYKTGDLGRYLPDGNIEYLGRNDHQIKLRGFRIELGEIEARIAEFDGVRECVVLAREDQPGDKRLVAYYVAQAEGVAQEALRAHLASHLPEHMLPHALMELAAMPLSPNGKLERRALPAPQIQQRAYTPPQGEVETRLAQIWCRMLKLERVGRDDNFFELGGHSLLAMSLIEAMRVAGLHTGVRTLFAHPTLAGLAFECKEHSDLLSVPENKIPAACTQITPDMLGMVSLTAEEIAAVCRSVRGGAANVQDIYPLAPLQEGILFHHRMEKDSDPYLMYSTLRFADEGRLQAYLHALRAVLARHDILRTAVVWEGVPQPLQVVWREVELVVETLDCAGPDVVQELLARVKPEQYRMDVSQAPLRRLFVARDQGSGAWFALQLHHHLIDDNTSLRLMHEEIEAYLLGEQASLSQPLPFRQFVWQARNGVSQAEHESFFKDMLGKVDEPGTVFGLHDVQGDGSGIGVAHADLPLTLCQRLRQQARQHGVSNASLFHLAWAQVLARLSGRRDVVFGSVLFGRMQAGAGAERALGVFINTLPLLLEVGTDSVQQAVRATHTRLSQLLRHEHASLALAQRASAVPAPAPLFTAILNYRHVVGSVPDAATLARRQQAWQGIDYLDEQERTNYPLTLSINDFGQQIGMEAQIDQRIDAQRICALMECALQNLVRALEQGQAQGQAQGEELACNALDVLPSSERELVLQRHNQTACAYPQNVLIHEMFEQQAACTPHACAVFSMGHSLDYASLNQKANRLARHLRSLGLGPDQRVAICVERSLEMVIGLLAILKAGAAYVPLDPGYPQDRLRHMLHDSSPGVVLTHGRLQPQVLANLREMAGAVPLLDLEQDAAWLTHSADNLPRAALLPQHLAYVIYTSGSTGLPKGVMNEHAGVVNRLQWMQQAYQLSVADVVLQKTSFSFDVSVWEFFWPLMTGAKLVMAKPEGHKDPHYLAQVIQEQGVTTLHFVPSMLQVFLEIEASAACHSLRRVVTSGEALPASLARRLRARLPQAGLHNLYGPTEAAVDVTYWDNRDDNIPDIIPIGKPVANTQIYLLDEQLRPVPFGVAGEIHIGGVQVARGYLNRPELSRERFIPDPFAGGSARLYKTGDLGRYQPDGNIEYLGRNDHQIKLRGFRIELGEIEARIAEFSGVRECVVLAREDRPGDKRLVAYCVAKDGISLNWADLRAHLATQLPEHMLPAAFVSLPAMPLSANGKLERKALPAPEGESGLQREYQAPQGAMEERLAAAWCSVLQVPQAGRLDNFFELGGHSLLLMQLHEQLRRQDLQADVRDLFAAANLQDMAKLIKKIVSIEL